MTADQSLLAYCIFTTWMAVSAHMAIDNTLAVIRWARRRP